MHDEINIEQFKDLIDSRTLTKAEKAADSLSLLKARHKSLAKSNEVEQTILDLYRLKLMLEEEAKTDELKSGFYTYSSTYVDLVYTKRKSFAFDIDFSETQVSLILSGKRPPTEEFVSKISAHSNAVYKKLNIDFNSHNWFAIYYLDRMHNYLSNKKKDTISLKNINIGSLKT